MALKRWKEWVAGPGRSFGSYGILGMMLISSFLLESKCLGNRCYGSFSHVEYVGNYDGDTITFRIQGVHPIIGENIKVRIRGVNTPEIRGKCEKERLLATEARDFVARVLGKAKKIELRNVARGKYFRIVADVFVDGRNLKVLLLERGLGVPYDGGRKRFVFCRE